MANETTRDRNITAPGGNAKTVGAGNPVEDMPSFADLLDGWSLGPGDSFSAADHVNISIDLDNDALILTIHDPHGANPDPTVVTLAGLGIEYAAYDGLHLSDIIKGIDSPRAGKADLHPS